MPDQLTRVKELLERLQESILRWREHGGSHKNLVQWLDGNEAEIREFCEMKGATVVEHFLGMAPQTINRWRHQRSFTDPPAVASQKKKARARELQVCLLRLKEAKGDLQNMQPRKWLDLHRADVEFALTSGIRRTDLAELLKITDTTFGHWCRDREVIQPIAQPEEGEEGDMNPSRETLEETGQGRDGDSWQRMSAKEFQQLVAKDINSLGLKESYQLWRGRGVTPQRWGVTVQRARVRGLIPGEEHAQRVEEEPAGPEERAWYYRGKYEGMKEALAAVFRGNHVQQL